MRNQPHLKAVSAAFVLILILILAPGIAGARVETSSSLLHLAGRWLGEGSLVPVRGPTMPFKCVATYIPADDGASMRQNLRCKSADYKLETATVLEIEGTRVSGRWEDKINALDGSVSGTVTKDGFEVFLSGRFFQARMQVAGSGCEQSVTVTPEKADYIRELTASLKKC